jgi:1L-myo-inositol 1-phosphate cytidylyltransferase
MRSGKPDVVVILAAGLGSRLGSDEGVPKPLRPVAGRALVSRVLDRFHEAGVREAVVVLGHRGDEVRAGIEAAGSSMEVSFVENPRYRMSNGLSVLAARPAVGDRPFFLSMSDHVFEASLIEGLAAAPLPEGGLVLAVDRKLDTIYDMEDATLVRTEEGRIVEIHKSLEHFDCVDTGLFSCTPALFDAIAAAASTREDGDCSLSDGVGALAAAGLAMVHDVGPGLWQDVDTPGSAAHAEKLFSGA